MTGASSLKIVLFFLFFFSILSEFIVSDHFNGRSLSQLEFVFFPIINYSIISQACADFEVSQSLLFLRVVKFQV